MSDLRQHLRVITPNASEVSAEREIAVRFTSASGLIAPIRKPLNSFGWVGPATLSFSGQGVLVAAKRATLLGLRQTQRFIGPAEIRDVYREANAVQVHLRGSRDPYFRLWAENSASAAQIVALLPTRRTVEFESDLRQPEIVIAWRLPAVGFVALLVVSFLMALAWFAGHRGLAVRAPDAASLAQSHPPIAIPKPGPVATQGDDALYADQDLIKFGARSEALSAEFATAFQALMDGSVSQERFANELDQWLRPQWDELEAGVRRTNAAPGSLRDRADHELIGTINNWQLALYAYADDLRNRRQVVRSFDYIRRAEWHYQRVEQMQSELERASASPKASTTAPR